MTSQVLLSLLAVAAGGATLAGLRAWLRPSPANPQIWSVTVAQVCVALSVVAIPAGFIWFSQDSPAFKLTTGVGLSLLLWPMWHLLMSPARRSEKSLARLLAGQSLAHWIFAPHDKAVLVAAELAALRRRAQGEAIRGLLIVTLWTTVAAAIQGPVLLLAAGPAVALLLCLDESGAYYRFRNLHGPQTPQEPDDVLFGPDGILLLGRFVPLVEGLTVWLETVAFQAGPRPQMLFVTRSWARRQSRANLVIPIPARYLTEAEALAARYQPFVKKD